MNDSRKKKNVKNDFLNLFGFLSAKSHFHKSTKTRFPENSPKMVELHEYRNSSEMVVRGWYMTHFDRRDIPKSKKIGLGRFPQHIRPYWADLGIFTIFSEISSRMAGPGK